MTLDLLERVRAARARIAPFVRHTPVERSPWLSELGGCEAYLKLECWQRTGSFKLRGALNKLLAIGPEARARGVVAASTGNHGSAVAWGAFTLGCPATIFAPRTASASKLAAVRELGVAVETVGEDCLEAEAAARAFARETGATYVSPYNDLDVVAGQGTLALELQEDLEHLDAVIVSVGGGGLASGVGGALPPDVELIGCSPRNSAVMHASLRAGRLLDLPSEPTLSDGTAGGVEAGSITFELCREHVDDFVLVDEAEIAAGVRDTLARHHVLVEGAAGAAVAAFRQDARRWTGKAVAIVLCGANIAPDVLAGILQENAT